MRGHVILWYNPNCRHQHLNLPGRYSPLPYPGLQFLGPCQSVCFCTTIQGFWQAVALQLVFLPIQSYFITPFASFDDGTLIDFFAWINLIRDCVVSVQLIVLEPPQLDSLVSIELQYRPYVSSLVTRLLSQFVDLRSISFTITKRVIDRYCATCCNAYFQSLPIGS